ncbi:MAG: glycine/betaine ABC transporter permease, partial [Rhodobacteraceae bacterium]|nr:glycine/betaine ABC transporter permease [Paracoccaceae bacterium]
MTEATAPVAKGTMRHGMPGVAVILLVMAAALAVLRPFLPEALLRVPDWLIGPYDVWMQASFDFIKDDLGLIRVTRAVSAALEWVLDATANLLYGKNRWPYAGPLAWSSLAAVAVVVGYAAGQWRLALLAGATFVWIALVGQWELAMQTLSVLIVAAPLAFSLGLVLGILAWKS